MTEMKIKTFSGLIPFLKVAILKVAVKILQQNFCLKHLAFPSYCIDKKPIRLMHSLIFPLLTPGQTPSLSPISYQLSKAAFPKIFFFYIFHQLLLTKNSPKLDCIFQLTFF